MPDPITHAASPLAIATLSTAASFLFDLPLGVVITAVGGAYWAVYRNKSLKVGRSILLIIGATLIAVTLVHGVTWMFDTLLNMKDIPQRPVAFLLGFAVIDKPFRDSLIAWAKSKFDFLQVQK
ncbi:hypothetical protein C3Y98_04730 [Methylotenera oryzisoli]|uniref:Phage holin n=1 Tax=Methylotenera oryzisoli TaxID=2080758 RepID=A0A4Y9VR29_9PROT|nr:hypothetical protein [Methylotenera oryzisoli]TFW71414.1 hypothetical protein C3Y98_04730 [Methylotenera oryzisoli]